jgi:hypothetical protein
MPLVRLPGSSVQISFKMLGLRDRSTPIKGVVQLLPGDWDDYSFKTSFTVVYFDAQGKRVDLGSVKIGYMGQPKGWTKDHLPPTFVALPEEWFSLGQDVEYYKTAASELSPAERNFILTGLRDVVADDAILVRANDESVCQLLDARR